jgi:hypothetical protein
MGTTLDTCQNCEVVQRDTVLCHGSIRIDRAHGQWSGEIHPTSGSLATNQDYEVRNQNAKLSFRVRVTGRTEDGSYTFDGAGSPPELSA